MAALLEYQVTEENAGKTVEKIVRKHFGISSGLLSFLKNNGRLRINGNICRSVDVCEKNDMLTVDVSENLAGTGNIVPWNMALDILYEDEFIIVINKPGGMAAHPCRGNYENSLANAVVYYWAQKREYHNYHIVNRLDKDTSGICILAKNRFAHSVLSEQIKNKIFERGYSAIVHGLLCPSDGVIEIPIKRDYNSIIKRIASPDGKYARTNYKTVQTTEKGNSLLSITLDTGRTHQIRVHFSHIGHPLFGDWLYGMGDSEKYLIERQALHAGYVKFQHPVYKNTMAFEVPFPDEMVKLLNRL